MSTVIKVNGINIHHKLEGPESGPTIVFSRPVELANVLGKIASTNHEY